MITSQLRILFLEDNPADFELMIRELESAGYKIDSTRAETEQDFLDNLDSNIDVILADYTLPQFDALKAIHLLQERELNIPLIVVSGTISEEAAVECIKEGAWDYLLKDRLTRLGPAIEQALNEKKLRDEKRLAEGDLRDSEERYRSLVEVSPETIVVHSKGKIVYINPTGVKLVKARNMEELIGRDIFDFVPQNFKEIVAERVRLVQEEQKTLPALEEKLFTLDGNTIEVEISGGPLLYQNQPATQLIIRDISARKRRERELEALVTVSTALRVAYNRDDIPEVLMDQLPDLLEVEALGLIKIDLISGDTVLEAAAGNWASKVGGNFSVGDKINNKVIENVVPYLSNDINQDQLISKPKQLNGINALTCLPLMAQGEILGTMWVGRVSAIDEEEVRLYSAVADMAANAIQRANTTERLESSFIETVLALAKTMDARDAQIADHSQRLAILAENTLRALGGNLDEIEAIRWAALLHDIGKIAVPDEILRKVGPLSEKEWDVMKKHPDMGAEIVSPVEKLSHVAPIIRAHQENYDGSGYPLGLASEAIPKAARVLRVVDAFGAMTEDRVYRERVDYKEALNELQRCAGRDFDPLVVETFIKVINEMNPLEDN
ncbi:MAG: PAS domain S-box protein [Chloroflexi bacterium]|nr:PAS domain S-box protein [Chloroflexota bacterium]